MVNVAPADVPPDVVTVTLAVPTVAMSLAGTTAVSEVVPLPGMVCSATPFQFTFAGATKFVPVTVRLKAAPPAVADLGLRLVIFGAPGLMVNVVPGDVPPVVVTVTLAVPGVAKSLAGTAAVIFAALTNDVVSPAPFHFAAAPGTKFVPLMVSVRAALPAFAALGLKPVIVGGASSTVNIVPAEVTPSVVTVTLAVPAVAIKLAGTAASSVFALTNKVDSAVPFQLTVVPGMKFVPVTVRGKAGPPTVAELGLRLVIVGATGLMVNVAATDVPRIVVTITLAVPGVVIRLAGTAASSVFALTYSVGNGVPFHFTVALEKKFVPVTLRGNAGPPAIAELGLMLAIVGGTFFMVNVAPSDVPRIVVTETVAVPGVAIRLAGTVAVSWLVPTKAVASGMPFQFTVAPEKRYVPFTVSVNVAPPAAVELGLKLVIVGPSVSRRNPCVTGQLQ
jgi:hypothetical protein